MIEKLVISENCCNFIVLNYKELQATIAMITEDKITELFVWQMISASFLTQ